MDQICVKKERYRNKGKEAETTGNGSGQYYRKVSA